MYKCEHCSLLVRVVTHAVVIDLAVPHTVNWKIFKLKIFHKQKNSCKKFCSYGWAKFFNMRAYVGRKVMSWIRLRVRDLALKSSEGIVASTVTMYIKRCGRQLLEKCWSVWKSRTMFKVDMLWLQKKMGTIMARRLSRVCSFFSWRGGYDILYSDWGEKILRRSVHHVELTLCTVHKSARVIFVL